MAARTAPLEVGTRGTVGSLLKKEIEYFRRLQLDCCGTCAHQSHHQHRHVPEMASNASKSWTSFRFLPWKRKKRRGINVNAASTSSGIVRPGICSMVEVVNSRRWNDAPSFGYKNLRADMEEV
ncbi:OLC1v1021983C1 [Oldenlandia corymbosa var. corymbosa]|uniref:OLC1v1021983C1 n=1 Tax=Oldenlandia corymbosa var. corymbosa TaxID=529605 RepID=A0AAV1BZK7_OLDCO|nr:OLC1v1021983C1 [Oldenlandia corymbosa var. corymbosa]